ncbi:MAG: PilN domain-containing protein [Hyphomicrobiaceae bacterium]
MTNTSIMHDQTEGGRQQSNRSILQAWFDELAGIAVVRHRHQNRRHVRIWISNDTLRIFDCTRRQTRPVAFDPSSQTPSDAIDWSAVRRCLDRSRLSHLSVVLCLGADRVLAKPLKLPAAATSVLEPVLRNQMRRLSPWPEDETQFGFRAGEAGRTGPGITVEVVVAHRPMIEDVRQKAAAAGLDFAAICHASEPESRASIEIDSTDGGTRDQAARRIKWMLAMLLMTSLGLGALGYYELYAAIRMQAGLDSTISAAKSRIAQSRRQAEQQRAIARRREALIAKKSDNPPAVWVLNAMSQAVPDHSWLNRLTFQNNSVLVTGTSTNSAALVPALESSGMFTQVRFSGPTTRDPKTSRESFSISAVVNFAGLEKVAK